MVSHLSWAIWANSTQSLIWFELNEQICDERMSEFPALVYSQETYSIYVVVSFYWPLFNDLPDPTPKKRKQPILSHIVGVSFSTVYQRFTDFCMVDFFWRMGFVNRHLVYRSVFYRDNFSFLTYCKTFFCKFRFLSRQFFDNFSYKQIHKKRGWENCVKLRNSWCYMSKN